MAGVQANVHRLIGVNVRAGRSPRCNSAMTRMVPPDRLAALRNLCHRDALIMGRCFLVFRRRLTQLHHLQVPPRFVKSARAFLHGLARGSGHPLHVAGPINPPPPVESRCSTSPDKHRDRFETLVRVLLDASGLSAGGILPGQRSPAARGLIMAPWLMARRLFPPGSRRRPNDFVGLFDFQDFLHGVAFACANPTHG